MVCVDKLSLADFRHNFALKRIREKMLRAEKR